MSDLIAAVATPPGTGGVGILRLSGPGAAQAAARVFRPKGTRALPDAPDRQLLYGTLLDQAGQALDTGLAFVSRAPHSYTGEETAELQCHGSPIVLSLVLDALFAAGARQARAGEFTRRAFLNGKMDLTEAEAVIDLIDAQSAAAARQAAGQLTGALSRRIDAIYSGLTDVMAHFCAVLDYPDEDLDPFQTQQLQEALQAQEEALTALLPVLEAQTDWTRDAIFEACKTLAESMEKKNGWLLFPLGIALSGKSRTPGGGTDLAAMMGKEETVKRVKAALEKL